MDGSDSRHSWSVNFWPAYADLMLALVLIMVLVL